MKKLHAKSPCCRGEIYRFGNRRRQCKVCKKTWRIRQKKKGRKKKRESSDLLIKYLNHQIPSLHALANMRGVTERSLQARLERSQEFFLKNTPWPTLPKKGDLVLVADAMIKYIDGNWYTFYFMLVKKATSNCAVIAPPYIRKGTETNPGWRMAIDTLPEPTKSCIRAVVCDGHKGLIDYAKWSGWLIQRCHFHLIARIQSRRSKWKQSRHREEGQMIYDLVNYVLTTTKEENIKKYIQQIEEVGWSTKSPDLSRTLLGFVNHYEDFRTCFYHPKLNLPRTNNTAESLIGCVRNLNHRARGFSTLSSLKKWICAFIKNKKKIKCNGFFQPS